MGLTDYYGAALLLVYDYLVLGLINSCAWCCSTERILLPFFCHHLSANHLDIGPGTGWYLLRCVKPHASVSVFDYSPAVLSRIKAVLKDKVDTVTCYKGDVLNELDTELLSRHCRFASVSAMYLLHCVRTHSNIGQESRRPIYIDSSKFRVLALMAHAVLNTDGIYYGATVIPTMSMNLFARTLMLLFNYIGIFHNLRDTEADLVKDCVEVFGVQNVATRRVGETILFVCKKTA